MPTMPLAQSNRGAPLGHHSSRSWRVRRLEDCNRDRLADANVESFDTWSGIIPQPDRLGAKREGALMARFDEGQPASALRRKSAAPAASVKRVVVPARKTRLGSS